MSTDSEIIRRSAETPSAFAELFDRYAPALYRYASRRAGDFVADDVMSETFLIAFEGRDGFDHAWSDARPWLFGIATNLLRRHHRSEARMLKALARATPREAHHGGLDLVPDQIDAAAATTGLAGALRGMAAADRETLLLYAWADLTYEGIALATGVPVGTVRSRLNRARRILREAIGTDSALEQEEDDGRAHSAPKHA